MDLLLREAAERIGADDVLRKIDRLMKWQSFLPILKRGLRGYCLSGSICAMCARSMAGRCPEITEHDRYGCPVGCVTRPDV